MNNISRLLFIPIITILLYSCGVSGEDNLELSQEKLDSIAAEGKRLELEFQRSEKIRVDSLNYYTSKAEEKFEKHKISSGILFLDSALVFSNESDKYELIDVRASKYFKLKKYEESKEDRSTLLNASINEADNHYERALCYKKLHNTKAAVYDLTEAIKLNHKEAKKLHDKINPIKKRVSYYVTRCCDGTTSNATGRGACSHHGGVCNWNEPVYEEYRKY